MFGFRFILRHHEPSELKKTSSGCVLDDTVDEVSLPWKLDVVALSNVTPDSAIVNRQLKDEDSQSTSITGPKGGITSIFCGKWYFHQNSVA